MKRIWHFYCTRSYGESQFEGCQLIVWTVEMHSCEKRNSSNVVKHVKMNNPFQNLLSVSQVEMVYKIVSHMAANDRAVFAEGNCGTPKSATVYTGECEVEDLYDE